MNRPDALAHCARLGLYCAGWLNLLAAAVIIAAIGVFGPAWLQALMQIAGGHHG